MTNKEENNSDKENGLLHAYTHDKGNAEDVKMASIIPSSSRSVCEKNYIRLGMTKADNSRAITTNLHGVKDKIKGLLNKCSSERDKHLKEISSLKSEVSIFKSILSQYEPSKHNLS